MKAILTLGALGATANAGVFTDLHAKNQRIINNPFNQKLFAEMETTASSKTTATKTEMKSTSNLRKMANRIKGKGKLAVVEGYANPDCTGPLTMYYGVLLNNCIAGINHEGHGVSSAYVAKENPLSIDEVLFKDNYKCNGNDIETEDLLAELPFDETYQFGTCAMGFGMKGDVINFDDIRNDMNGIVFTLANSPGKCEHGEAIEFNVMVDGICYEDDDKSMSYHVNDCASNGGFFTKKYYSDSSCNFLDETITENENFETCRFNYDAFSDDDFVQGGTAMYEFSSMRCNAAF